MGKIMIVVGGQFGSEGKGALAAWLARREQKPLLAVRVAGPNAGHTAYDDAGREWKLQQVPVAGVVRQFTPGQITLAVAAGSEIDLEILEREISQMNEAGLDVGYRLVVDSEATIIDPEHVRVERGVYSWTIGELGVEAGDLRPHGEAGLTKRIGSTGKGVGAARADRIMRSARTYGGSINVAKMMQEALWHGHTVMIEGTQGYGLGLHAGFYPYCTSSDCRAIDFAAMAGLDLWWAQGSQIWMAIRPHPIRVAGDSGPLKNETTWETLGLRPEFTTVTKKVRRVGHFDAELVKDAIRANGKHSVKLALMFGDYLDPNIAGKTMVSREEHSFIQIYEAMLGHKISAVGTGPTSIAEVI